MNSNDMYINTFRTWLISSFLYRIAYCKLHEIVTSLNCRMVTCLEFWPISPCSTWVFSWPKQFEVIRLSHSAFVLVKIIVCPPAPKKKLSYLDWKCIMWRKSKVKIHFFTDLNLNCNLFYSNVSEGVRMMMWDNVTIIMG